MTASSGHPRCSPMFHRRINRGVRVGEDLTARRGAARVPCPFSRVCRIFRGADLKCSLLRFSPAVSGRVSLRVHERFLTFFPVIRVAFSWVSLHFSWPNNDGGCGRFVWIQLDEIHFVVCRVFPVCAAVGSLNMPGNLVVVWARILLDGIMGVVGQVWQLTVQSELTV